jgi:hypothetical protein
VAAFDARPAGDIQVALAAAGRLDTARLPPSAYDTVPRDTPAD